MRQGKTTNIGMPHGQLSLELYGNQDKTQDLLEGLQIPLKKYRNSLGLRSKDKYDLMDLDFNFHLLIFTPRSVKQLRIF